MQMYIVLAVFLLFVAVILTGKVAMPVAAMMIPVILEITGVLTFEQAWAGLTNSSVIMMASMFIVGTGLSKTSLVSNLSKTVIKPGSSDRLIMVGIAIPVIFLGCFVNATATLTIMIPLIRQICAEQKRPMSKFMEPTAILALLWVGAIPTGGNAGSYLGYNTIIENLGGVGTYTYFTDFISKIPALIFMTALVIFLYPKITPDNGNIPSVEGVGESSGKDGKKSGRLSPGKEKMALVIFAGTILGIMACAVLKKPTWYPSTVGALLMCLFGILSDREAIRSAGSPVIFIFVGSLPLSTALKTTGADVALVSAFNSLTGGLPPLAIMILIYIICMVLTQFITNSAVSNAFRTMAAMIAVQNGYDPRAFMLAVGMGSGNCYFTPMAAPAMTMAYPEGEYTMKQYFKLGIPAAILRFLCYVVWVPFVFPMH